MTRVSPAAVPSSAATTLPAGESAEAQRWPGQTFVTFAALIYLLFVVYGSLVPLNYQPAQSLQRLQLLLDSSQFDWSRQSRADLVANVLLPIPLLFFWCAVMTAGGRRWPVAAPLLVCLGSACVSLGVELLQAYFPPRTPSLVDFAAQLTGAALGTALWSAFGRSTLAWVAGIRLLTTIPSLAVRVLVLYGVGMLCYGLFPLDLSLSISDVYRKWRDGRVILLPFSGWWHVDAKTIYGFATDVALFVPIGILGRLSFPHFKWAVVLAASFAAAALEFLQLFVLSRTTDATQIAAACFGASIGVALAARIRMGAPGTSPPGNEGFRRQPFDIRLLLAALGWFVFVCMVYWYPYDFRAVPAVNITREWLSGAPFTQLFFQTELRAVTELLRKTLFFAPLGALFAFAMPFPREPWARWLRPSLAVAVLLGAPIAVEYGKLFLPDKFPGGANVAMEFAGGVIGYRAAVAWMAWRSGAFLRETERAAVPPRTTLVEHVLPGIWRGGAVVLAGLLMWLLTISGGPYVPHPDYRYVSMLLVGGALVWTAGYPAWIAWRIVSDPRALARYPLLLLAYALVASILMLLGVEASQVQKLVGVPVLDWPEPAESLLRLQALMTGVGSFAILGCITGGDRRDFWRCVTVWLMHSVWLLPLAYWGGFVEAAAGNLVELLKRGASPSATLSAGLAITTIFAAAVRVPVVVSRAPAKRKLLALLMVVFSMPIGFWLLRAASETVIITEGRAVSGMQLILGMDRVEFAQEGALFLRYCLVHLFCALAIAICSRLFVQRRSLLPAPPAGRENRA